ncbi:unnamed protein product [Ceutorhynchus assimilis]|uniref:Uncharacterized protein n=1 Tax=Ceutorhynchus assimilis TaxID=467358 RepID=A0A9N9QIQ6_9CUCU|nr:unnamed protein product [Ceutorhynchus assimilis]
MNWIGTSLLLLALITTQTLVSAQDDEDIETTTTIDEVSTDEPSTEENRILLDSKLRTALLQALSEIENEEDDEQTISQAQASAITIIKDADDKESIVKSEDTSEDIQTNDATPTTTIPSSSTQATQVLFQKSEAVQSKSITSLEKIPLDAFKDAEQIITSASNSFLTSNNEDNRHNEHIEVRSVPNRESVLQNEQNSFQANTKTSNFPTLNDISNKESKKPSKFFVEKFSFGKAVDSPTFVRTSYSTSYKTSSSSKVSNSKAENVKTSTSGNNNNNNNEVKAETVTQSTPEISTEENEAKVEQVQFFSAPLVAAFTVHQDEAGQPKKVEPIYKNGLETKKEKVATVQQQTVFAPQPTQTLLQSSSFNTLSLQQKQQILQQELEKLRGQQQNLQSRNNFANVNSNNIGFTQNGFRQAINQNFNHLDPVFTEPDRSVVTKLATIDPSNILSQNSDLFLNRFTANEAILPLQNNNFNQADKPNRQNEVTLVPSITFDPLSEAGKLPKNAQILPNKEPTGFNTIPKVEQQQQNFNFANQQFIQPLPNKESTGFNKQNFVQSNINSFVRPQQNSFVQNNQFANQPQRFLRKEQGTGNFGLNQQNTFSIVPSQQPYQPKIELSYFPDNRFLRQNEAVLAQPQQNFVSQNRFQGFNNFPTQNTNRNRFFRSNLEGTLQNVQQPFNNIPQNTRYYRSNQEATLTSPQNFGFIPQAQNVRILRSNQENTYLSNQNNAYYQTPLLQNYRYSQSFGIPTH